MYSLYITIIVIGNARCWFEPSKFQQDSYVSGAEQYDAAYCVTFSITKNSIIGFLYVWIYVFMEDAFVYSM